MPRTQTKCGKKSCFWPKTVPGLNLLRIQVDHYRGDIWHFHNTTGVDFYQQPQKHLTIVTIMTNVRISHPTRLDYQSGDKRDIQLKPIALGNNFHCRMNHCVCHKHCIIWSIFLCNWESPALNILCIQLWLCRQRSNIKDSLTLWLSCSNSNLFFQM